MREDDSQTAALDAWQRARDEREVARLDVTRLAGVLHSAGVTLDGRERLAQSYYHDRNRWGPGDEAAYEAAAAAVAEGRPAFRVAIAQLRTAMARYEAASERTLEASRDTRALMETAP